MLIDPQLCLAKTLVLAPPTGILLCDNVAKSLRILLILKSPGLLANDRGKHSGVSNPASAELMPGSNRICRILSSPGLIRNGFASDLVFAPG